MRALPFSATALSGLTEQSSPSGPIHRPRFGENPRAIRDRISARLASSASGRKSSLDSARAIIGDWLMRRPSGPRV